jgi:predicted nucleotide-binding protein
MDSLIELTNFYQKISKYEDFVRKGLKVKLTRQEENKIRDLGTELQRDYSRLDEIIEHYGGYGVDFRSPLLEKMYGKKIYTIFGMAFGPLEPARYIQKLKALVEIKRIVNAAIGKLEKEGKSWDIPIKKREAKSHKPKVFISCSGKSTALTELRDFLNDMGIEKLLVVKKPNLDRTINVKVEEYLDEADFVIILATGDSKDRNDMPIPAGNVIHEIGLAQAKHKLKGKIIYLIEEGVEFPSNIKPKGYVRFNRDNIEHIFGDIVKEIKEMGFLH